MEKVISQWNRINESDFYENDEAVVLSILGDENSANPEHFYSHEWRDRISPYDINTILSRQVMRIQKNINKGI